MPRSSLTVTGRNYYIKGKPLLKLREFGVRFTVTLCDRCETLIEQDGWRFCPMCGRETLARPSEGFAIEMRPYRASTPRPASDSIAC
jgi:hypothetical protein